MLGKPYTFTADSKSPDQKHHDIFVYITKGPTGAYVGHVKGMPGVVVQAETEAKLAGEVMDSVSLLWNSFPEVHDKLYPSHVSAKEVARQGYGFQQEVRTIEVTVPRF